MTRPPKHPLRHAPLPAAELAREVLRAADAEGVSVLLVGGPVRDLLLERPLVDIDLLVEDPDPTRLKALCDTVLRSLPEAKVTHHERFGTAILRTADAALDLATMRSESYSHPGALPTVAAGDLEQDLARRDFSVNALALPLSKAARSRHSGIVDFQGGLEDLAAARLRVLHKRSFHDDPTRALRAARLGPRLGFTLARGSRGALRDALRDGSFGRVSGDRLRRELVRVFADAPRGLDPTRALRALDDWHVLGALEPGLTLPKEVVLPLRRLGRAIVDPPWQSGRWQPWMAGLGLWLGPLPAALRRRTLKRIGVRGEPARRIGEQARTLDKATRALTKARGRGAIDRVLGQLGEEELFALYTQLPPAARRRVVRYAEQDRARRIPITGADLVAAGLRGPNVGRALERVRIAWLDGAVDGKADALALAREVARRRGRSKG